MIIIALNLYKQILFNAVQPTSTANLPTTMSSPTAPIALTMAYTLGQESAYTSSLHVLTVQPTPTITPKPNASFKTLSGSYDSEMLLSVSKLYIKLSIIIFFKPTTNRNTESHNNHDRFDGYGVAINNSICCSNAKKV